MIYELLQFRQQMLHLYETKYVCMCVCCSLFLTHGPSLWADLHEIWHV